MSNKESNKKNQRNIRRSTRAPAKSAVVVRKPVASAFSLYRFVYESTTSVVVCFFLILSFFSQGVSIVFASEEGGGDELVAIPLIEEFQPEGADDTSQAAVEAEPSNDSLPTAESEAVLTESLAEEDSQSVVTDETLIIDVSPPVDESESSTEEVVTDDTVSDDTSSSDSEYSSDTTSTTTDQGSIEADTTGEDDATETTGDDEDSSLDSDNSDSSSPEDGVTEDNALEDIPSPQATTTEATSSELIGPGISEPVGTSYSDSGFMFSKDECTELASGSFYCLEPRDNVLEDALFAAPDQDGDLEIFLVRNGTQTQVTDNFVDDAAPFFDQNSETIVWHRLIDDRYQIISYELASGEEVQLTRSGTNNMEPVRQGKYTVWQRWVSNNWDIILYDGETEVQVSHASAHDIAPYIHGALVVWNRYGATGEKTIEMYDIASETYVTVDDPEGLSVTNPRMVLVYDQMHPNGDITTKGYDMIARKFIQLDTLPRDLPDEIPESDPTSETRALIQSKPSVKGDEQVQTEPVPGGVPPPDSASSTDSLTLDLRTDTVPDEAYLDTTPPELLTYDLVIPSQASSSEIAEVSVQE